VEEDPITDGKKHNCSGGIRASTVKTNQKIDARNVISISSTSTSLSLKIEINLLNNSLFTPKMNALFLLMLYLLNSYRVQHQLSRQSMDNATVILHIR
jgi:hypothetical protein